MERRVIFLDIDGTLLPSGGSVSKRDISALAKARLNGHLVLVNTGRAPGFWPKEEMRGVHLDGACLGCGSLIWLNGGLLVEKWMPEQLVRDLIDCAGQTGMHLILEGETGMYEVNRSPSGIFDACSPLPENFLQEAPLPRIAKVCVSGPLPDRGSALLAAHFQMIRHPEYWEGVPLGAGKGEAIRRVMDALRLPISKSVAMGDSLNDLEMLNAAGTRVAMGNACEELKAAADYVTAPVDQSGVAQALERLALI